MEQLAELLHSVAQSLGQTAETLFPYFVKQAQVSVITHSVFLALFITLLVVYTRHVVWYAKSVKRDTVDSDFYFDTNDHVWVLIAHTGAALIEIAFIIDIVGTILTAALNPEYWAIQKIISMIN